MSQPEEPLDPVTLRILAAELDAQEEQYRSVCPCPIHKHAAEHVRGWATDYRTRAIKIELGMVPDA